MTDLVDTLKHILERHARWVVLTGAGISADSGIPTYRDSGGKWLGADPILHQEFIQSPAKRQRYWGRSMLGWPGVRDAAPNRHHRALTRFEQADKIEALITQNVDRLHQRAGSQRVIDLHGRLDRVRCFDCGAGFERDAIQQRLLALNPHNAQPSQALRPDGDADLSDELVASIQVPHCSACGGLLMPDVVFFGGTIPRERVSACEAALSRADALLVVGSSLQVYSGFRICRQAIDQGKPLVIANEGTTRADDIASFRIHSHALTTLSCVLEDRAWSDPTHSPNNNRISHA